MPEGISPSGIEKVYLFPLGDMGILYLISDSILP